MTYEEFLFYLHHEDFHAVEFKWRGKEYAYAGWWIICWGHRDNTGMYINEGNKIYDTIDEWLSDPLFDGKTLQEVWDEVSETIDITLF